MFSQVFLVAMLKGHGTNAVCKLIGANQSLRRMINYLYHLWYYTWKMTASGTEYFTSFIGGGDRVAMAPLKFKASHIET